MKLNFTNQFSYTIHEFSVLFTWASLSFRINFLYDEIQAEVEVRTTFNDLKYNSISINHTQYQKLRDWYKEIGFDLEEEIAAFVNMVQDEVVKNKDSYFPYSKKIALHCE